MNIDFICSEEVVKDVNLSFELELEDDATDTLRTDTLQEIIPFKDQSLETSNRRLLIFR